MATEPNSQKSSSGAVRKPIRIDFCDFWPGFKKTDNFFYNSLKLRFEVEVTDQPQFLIYADPEKHLHRLHNCVRIYFGIESFLPDWTECDYAMTCRYLDDPRHLRVPFYVFGSEPESLDKANEDLGKVLASKTRFCGFVVSNAGKRKTQKRVDFFHRLSRYKRVDSGGRAFNNIGGPLPTWQAKMDFLRSCKFSIAFENSSLPGYTTEKIADAMQARSLPIYWGNPRIREEFNPKSFLNYFDYPNEESLIERIRELDHDDAKYLEVMRQPYFHNNRPNEFFSRERLLDFFEHIFATKTRPVSERRGFFRLGRWVAAKRNRPHGAPPGWA
jgi:alpha(1,3/1,4) fucosyltransferase